jgi:hypothetical protein
MMDSFNASKTADISFWSRKKKERKQTQERLRLTSKRDIFLVFHI